MSAWEFQPRPSGAPSALPLGRFPEGLRYRNREGIVPPENDLGGLRRRPRLGRRRARRALPGKAFTVAAPFAEGLPGGECHARHAPI